MRLVTYRATVEAEARLGVVADDLVIDLERYGAAHQLRLPARMLDLVIAGPHVAAEVSAMLDRSAGRWPIGSAMPLVNVRLLAPIPRPSKNIYGIGLNYLDHVAESAAALDTSPELPRQPVIFSKPPTSVIGPDDPIVHRADITQQLDWEVELGAIIGRTARRVSPEDALSYIFGYTLMLDMSARDCRRAGQWIYSKGQDSYAPMGPCIVTADEIPDPQTLELSLMVNGIEKQRSNTSHMLFKVNELVSDISQGITLEPGDIIATGTPDGVGAGRTPPEWLWPGDVITCTLEKIGSLRNAVIAG